tara:strand:- start:2009 stop:2662 length:654 start_codon:yes stop_codon:yes gene_type:complete
MNLRVKHKLILKKACERSSPIQVHNQIRNAFGSGFSLLEPATRGVGMRDEPEAGPVMSPITVPTQVDGTPVGEGYAPGSTIVEGEPVAEGYPSFERQIGFIREDLADKDEEIASMKYEFNKRHRATGWYLMRLHFDKRLKEFNVAPVYFPVDQLLTVILRYVDNLRNNSRPSHSFDVIWDGLWRNILTDPNFVYVREQLKQVLLSDVYSFWPELVNR